MPVSYDASSLLKCTVSMNYTRYFIGPGDSTESTSSSLTGGPTNPINSFTDGLDLNLNLPRYDSEVNLFDPAGQATFNFNQAFNSGLPSFLQ